MKRAELRTRRRADPGLHRTLQVLAMTLGIALLLLAGGWLLHVLGGGA